MSRPTKLSLEQVTEMRALRRTHGWKLEVLAAQFKVSVATASKVIRGEPPYEFPRDLIEADLRRKAGIES